MRNFVQILKTTCYKTQQQQQHSGERPEPILRRTQTQYCRSPNTQNHRPKCGLKIDLTPWQWLRRRVESRIGEFVLAIVRLYGPFCVSLPSVDASVEPKAQVEGSAMDHLQDCEDQDPETRRAEATVRLVMVVLVPKPRAVVRAPEDVEEC